MECIDSELRKCDPDYRFDLFENVTVKTGNLTVTFMYAGLCNLYVCLCVLL